MQCVDMLNFAMYILTCDHATCRCGVIQSLCRSGHESTFGVYPSLTRLQALLELEEAGREMNTYVRELSLIL